MIMEINYIIILLAVKSQKYIQSKVLTLLVLVATTECTEGYITAKTTSIL